MGWPKCSYQASMYSLLLSMFLFAWWLLSFWSRAGASGKNSIVSNGQADLEKYFRLFSGHTECGISLSELYVPPKTGEKGTFPRGSFCRNRETLLEAMTGGGRHGFDAPYVPKGCHYRWYSVDEICMILERFDSLVFIGGEALQTIYSGFNILLRRDLALGALKLSELSSDELKVCHCENQFIKDTCSRHAATSSEQISLQQRSPYLCSRTPHAFLHTTGSPLSRSTLRSLTSLIPHAPMSNYHPIPIIASLTAGRPPSTNLATQTLSELLSFADTSARKTPILWIGPSAAGHLDIGGRVGNNEIWKFSKEMEKVASENGVESLGMWNMTVQAESWDGRRFGSKVALAQAMMVVNWLSRLENS